MGNINLIASAGTGKTYSLITEVLNKIENENIPLKNILILTFTEKAASELKEKIADRIKEKIKDKAIPKETKVKLHKQLIYIDSGYIGTFHSVFLRFLKKYPYISNVDSSFSILSSQLDYFLETVFEKWIEQDFKNDEYLWSKIVKIFGEENNNLKKMFINLYKERLKIRDKKINLEENEEKIKNLSTNLEKLIDEFIKDYEHVLKKLKQDSPLFKISPFSVKQILSQKRYLDLIDDKDRIFIKKSSKNLTEKEKEIYQKDIKPILKAENFKKKENKIIDTINSLKKEALEYNANILLKKILDFIKFTENLKNEEKILDFNDILEKTLKVLKDEKVKKEIKNEFKYIFIDEFQDTDKIQTKIIKEISNDNIYIFGDPKQCIYTWRDADLNAYFDFIENQNFKDKPLDKNYRSCKNLVNFFNKILSENIILENLDKKFKKIIKSDKNYNGSIKLIKLSTDRTTKDEKVEDEALYTAKLIKDLTNQDCKYSDIMVLFRANKHMKIFKEILISKNIPVISSEENNIFETPEIKVLLEILKLIEFPKRKLQLVKILKSPFVLYEDIQLYKNRKNLDIKSLKIKNLETIKNLIERKYSLTVEDIIDIIYQDTDILETFSLIDDNGKILENLKKFKIIAKQKTLEGYSLRDFILFSETATIPEDSKTEEDAVNLLTMHKSKGLQSKVVIIPLIALEPDKLRLKNIHTFNEKILLNFPKAKSKEIFEYEKTLKKEIKNEWERLFYVAITRAEEKLIFIDSLNKTKHSFNNYIYKLLQKYPDILDIENIDIKTIGFENAKQEPMKDEDILEKLKIIKEKEERLQKIYDEAIKEIRFKSVSQIMEENKEDIKFDFSKKVDENTAIYIGIVVHNVLEKMDFKNFSKEELRNLVNSQKEIIPENIRDYVIKSSLKMLEKFENSQLHLELKNADILFRELPFTLYENGNYIEGRIDVVYEKNGEIVVMDYKTNRYETQEEKRALMDIYKIQKEYYLKAIKKIIINKKVKFKLGLLWKGEIV